MEARRTPTVAAPLKSERDRTHARPHIEQHDALGDADRELLDAAPEMAHGRAADDAVASPTCTRLVLRASKQMPVDLVAEPARKMIYVADAREHFNDAAAQIGRKRCRIRQRRCCCGRNGAQCRRNSACHVFKLPKLVWAHPRARPGNIKGQAGKPKVTSLRSCG